MEIVYVYPVQEPLTIRSRCSGQSPPHETIEGFPIWFVEIIGQNLGKTSFIDLLNHFKGIFRNCEYTLYGRPNQYSPDQIFPQPGQYNENNPYGMLNEIDLRLGCINPALLVDPNNTLTYDGVTRICATLENGIPEENRWATKGDNDRINLQFILEKETFPAITGWKKGFNKIVDKMTTPHYFYADTNTAWSTLQLLKILNGNYGIKPEIIDAVDEKTRSAIIEKLSTRTAKGTSTHSINYQI